MEDTFNLKQWKSDITLNEDIGDRLAQLSMDDLFQSVRNMANTNYISEEEAAEMAIEKIAQEFGVDGMVREDIDDDTAEKAPAGDKALNKRLSKADKIVKDYKRLRDLMKTELDMYKSFESPENKELAKNRLKKLTPEFQAAKKAYEKLKGVKL
jgi:hypothetical protein